MFKKIISPKATQRERVSWYFYDFGNSAYAAVVLLAVYSAYFKGQVVGGAEGSRLWGVAIGIAMLLVAISSPVLGTIADFSKIKKKILFFYTIMCCLATASLFFVQAGDIFLGMLLFIVAEFSYRSAQVYYNSLLPDIATPEEMGHVSGNGWAVGSVGGVVCLLIVLALIQTIGGTIVVRLSFIITAIFFILSSLPLFFFIKERGQSNTLPKGENIFGLAFKRLAVTAKEVRNYKQFVKFIIAFLIYNDGIIMTMNFAAILGAVLFGMDQQQLIIFMIVVQLTSIVGAFLFGNIADHFGGKITLVISLFIMIGAVVWMIFNYSLTVFFIIGGIAGFALTGVQSVSRTMVGQLSPENKSAEFYGFFAVAGRTSSFIGPTLYGIVAAEAALYFERSGLTKLIAEQTGQRYALASVIVFLLVGLIILITVNLKKSDIDTQMAAQV
ncbi:MAG: MFS transporter [Anaerolineaceae bacterium]|nr:MFS transporter [Anaerolineaceae bacterium]